MPSVRSLTGKNQQRWYIAIYYVFWITLLASVEGESLSQNKKSASFKNLYWFNPVLQSMNNLSRMFLLLHLLAFHKVPK